MSITYKYDALGRRVQRVPSNGATTSYIYDGEDVIKDIGSDGSSSEYLNGAGIDNKLRQMSSTTGALYYLTDHLGSTRALTDLSGNVVEQISYDTFGNSSGSAHTRYGYTGREWDGEANLYYYRARFYEAQAGRFISEDPVGFGGGVNFYAYVSNSPVNFNDPSGLCQGKTIRPDLPSEIRDIYTNPDAGRALTKCIYEVFGKDANRLKHQQLRNAPFVFDYLTGAQLAERRGAVGGQDRGQTRAQDLDTFRPNGAIWIAKDAASLPTEISLSPKLIIQLTYVHELGNKLSYQLTNGGTANAWGKPLLLRLKNPSIGYDDDTGNALEHCFYREIQK